jgi:crotonobetainyl-CoA:carnitine CoA-transferase CaiB-like acyl-CoA transferase
MTAPGHQQPLLDSRSVGGQQPLSYPKAVGGQQPLSGLKVVDMTTLAMGPLATQTLGDYGADVIKVESPAGDPFRSTLPTRSPGMGHVFLQLNRNKRSLALDLKAEPAQAAFRRLLAGADIFVSNVRPASMAGLSLDYEAVRAVNPGIIYCAAYGFSERGPYAGRPAADDTIQAMSGLVSLQGRASGTPQLTATVVADKAVGLMLVNAILAAVIHRMKTGEGQFIEMPMFEAMAAFVLPEHMAGLSYVPAQGSSGYARLINPMRRPHATADGWLCMLPYTTAQWHRFFRIIGREDLVQDAALADPVRRNGRLEELYGLMAAVAPSRTTAQWVTELLRADILFGEVFSPEQLIADPHMDAVGMFPEVEHPTEGPIRLIGFPAHSSAGATRLARLAPALGQDSRAVLAESGVPPAEIEAMLQAGQLIQACGTS